LINTHDGAKKTHTFKPPFIEECYNSACHSGRHSKLRSANKLMLCQNRVKEKRMQNELFKLILDNRLFNAQYYSSSIKQFFTDEAQALQHFLSQAEPAADPSLFFSVNWYLQTYPDVKQAGINPLQHFVTFGIDEGRKGQADIQLTVLKELDSLINQADKQRVADEFQQLLHQYVAEPAVYDAILYRLVQFYYMTNQQEAGFLLLNKLQQTWNRYSHSRYFFDICRIKSAWLAEVGEKSSAWNLLYHYVMPVKHWSSAIEALAKFVHSGETLNLYRQLLQKFIDQGGRLAGQSLLLYAMAARRIKNYNIATKALRQRLHLVLNGPRDIQSGLTLSALEQEQWACRAKTALIHLQREFDSFNQRFFLISGTLLGCIREQAILPFDKDIDVGVTEDVDLAQLAQKLRCTGHFLIQHHAHSRVLQLRHRSGVLIDIFQHWREGNKVWHSGQKARWHNSTFGLKQTEFLGQLFWIPDQPEQYLEENYGEWRVPARCYDTFIDTPNLEITDTQEMIYYFLKTAADHYLAGRYGHFHKIWQELRKQYWPGWRLWYRATRAAPAAALA
jgi:hypothetical protein